MCTLVVRLKGKMGFGPWPFDDNVTGQTVIRLVGFRIRRCIFWRMGDYSHTHIQSARRQIDVAFASQLRCAEIDLQRVQSGAARAQ
jgi:hypothetical protein